MLTLSCDHRVIDGAVGAQFFATLDEVIRRCKARTAHAQIARFIRSARRSIARGSSRRPLFAPRPRSYRSTSTAVTIAIRGTKICSNKADMRCKHAIIKKDTFITRALNHEAGQQTQQAPAETPHRTEYAPDRRDTVSREQICRQA